MTGTDDNQFLSFGIWFGRSDTSKESSRIQEVCYASRGIDHLEAFKRRCHFVEGFQFQNRIRFAYLLSVIVQPLIPKQVDEIAQFIVHIVVAIEWVPTSELHAVRADFCRHVGIKINDTIGMHVRVPGKGLTRLSA